MILIVVAIFGFSVLSSIIISFVRSVDEQEKELKRQKKVIKNLVKELGGKAYFYSGDVEFHPALNPESELGKVCRRIKILDRALMMLANKLGYRWEEAEKEERFVKDKRKDVCK